MLIAQQVLFRGLQVLGVYLLARAFPLSRWMALVVAAAGSLGATIAGPAVLTMEYEPVPRGFAIALLILAVGLAAQDRWMLASTAGSLALLYQAPTTFPFWTVFGFLILHRKRFRVLLPLACALIILLVASRFQAGFAERQAFFFRIDPELESLQRMRASYNWVSTWIGPLAWQYLFYWMSGLLAFWRVRPQSGRAFLLGLPLIGILSVPVSFILLERWKWGLIPQFQPARALLFVTLFASILGAAAAIRAAQKGGVLEAALWLTLVFAIPMQGRLADLLPRQWILAVGLALALAGVIAWPTQRWVSGVLASAIVLGAFVLPPTWGRVRNYPQLEDTGLKETERFLRERTPRDAMLLFGMPGKLFIQALSGPAVFDRST